MTFGRKEGSWRPPFIGLEGFRSLWNSGKSLKVSGFFLRRLRDVEAPAASGRLLKASNSKASFQ